MNCLWALSVICTAVWGLRMGNEKLEMNQAVPYAENAVGYDCNSVSIPAILAVCRLCESPAAFPIFHGEVSHLIGLYQFEIAQIFRALSAAKDQIPSANYTVAIQGRKVCFSASELDGKPNFHRVFQEFSRVPQGEIDIPEMFSPSVHLELEFIAVKVEEKDEGGFLYSGLTIQYSMEDIVSLAKDVEIAVSSLVITAADEPTVSYIGQTRIGQSTHPFTITVPYSRSAHSPVTLSIRPTNHLSVSLISQMFGLKCDGLASVPHVSSLESQPFTLVNLQFLLNPTTSTMEIEEIIGFFPMADAAVFPFLVLTDVIGQYRMQIPKKTCELLLSGNSDYTFPMKLSLIATEEQWTVVGGFEKETITVKEVEESLFRDLFIGERMLPQYENGENEQFIDSLYALELRNVQLRINSTPNPTLSLFGVTNWSGATNAVIQIVTGWVSNTVETVLAVAVTQSSELFSDFDYFSLIYSLFVASTSDIDLRAFPYMLGIFPVTLSHWRLGLYSELSFRPNSNCPHSDFCAVLQRSTAEIPQFSLSGTVISNKLALMSPLPALKLAPNLEFTETELVFHTDNSRNFIYITGAVTVMTGSNTVKRLIGRLSAEKNSAVLYGVTDEPWEIPEHSAYLTVGRGKLTAFLSKTDGLLLPLISARAAIGSNCTPGHHNIGCIDGSLEISLDSSSFSPIYTVFRTNSLSIPQFSHTVLSLSTVPFALQGLEFLGGIDLELLDGTGALGIVISGPISYFEVIGWAEIFLKTLKSDYAVGKMTLSDFYIGNYNVWVQPGNSGQIAMDLVIDSENTVATISGQVRFLDIHSDISISIDENGLIASFSGVSGQYLTDFTAVSSDFSSFQSANTTVAGQISVEQLRIEEFTVRTDLLYWISQGVVAGEAVDAWKDNATMETATAASEFCEQNACPMVETCLFPPEIVCKLYAQEEFCLRKKQSCVDRRQTCAQEDEICVEWVETCTENSEFGCVSYEKHCGSAMKVCREWVWTCGNAAETTCEEYAIRTRLDVCLEYENQCETAIFADSGCVQRCRQSGKSQKAAENTQKLYEKIYKDAVPMLTGFNIMSYYVPLEHYRSDLFYLRSFSFQGVLSRPGLTFADFQSEIRYSTYSAIGNTEVESRETVKWTMEQREENERAMFRAVKKTLIDNSNGFLPLSLSTATPIEHLLSSVYSSAL